MCSVYVQCVFIDEQMTSVFGYSFFLAKTTAVLGFVDCCLICCTREQHFSLRLKILQTYGDPTCVYFLPTCGDLLNDPSYMVYNPKKQI